MDKPRPCGCKGCRTCLICEEGYSISPKSYPLEKSNGYVYCPYCNKAYPGWDLDDYKQHPDHMGTPIDYPGVYIQLDFLSPSEEDQLIKGIGTIPWDLSQSGRRKQNFGPKCNFKKNKLKEGNFKGFPKFSKFVQDKFREVAILKEFHTIEQCSLEYDPERGASIDPHIDDCWIWGERIVTVNLLSDSVLTMTHNKKVGHYNLHLVGGYPSVVDPEGGPHHVGSYDGDPHLVVRIPMPNRSLLVLYGAARYDWEHQILREDITERRVCLAYREFTPVYLPGGEKYEEGEKILARAEKFWDRC